jgi:hypothetical protein
VIVVVTGSREVTESAHRRKVRASMLFVVSSAPGDDHELWEGSADGADVLARAIAKDDLGWGSRPFAANWGGPCVDTCPPDHRKTHKGGRKGDYCPLAGHRRNQMMVDRAREAIDAGQRVAFLAFPIFDPADLEQAGWVYTKRNRGTADCIDRAWRSGIPTIIIPLPLGATS